MKEKSKVGQISGCHKKTERIVHYEGYSCDHRFFRNASSGLKKQKKMVGNTKNPEKNRDRVDIITEENGGVLRFVI